jgi:hypothetical protein
MYKELVIYMRTFFGNQQAWVFMHFSNYFMHFKAFLVNA